MATTSQRTAAAAAAQQAKADGLARQEYFITDPNMRNIGTIRIQPGQKSINLTATEAKFFLGNGLSTVDPNAKGTASDGNGGQGQGSAAAETVNQPEETTAGDQTAAGSAVTTRKRS